MLSAAEETQGSTNVMASMWVSALHGAFPSFLEALLELLPLSLITTEDLGVNYFHAFFMESILCSLLHLSFGTVKLSYMGEVDRNFEAHDLVLQGCC